MSLLFPCPPPIPRSVDAADFPVDNAFLASGVDRLAGMKKPLETVIRSDGDLAELWSSLMGSGEVELRSLWLILLDSAGRVLPTIVPIDDVPGRPERRLMHGLGQIVSQLSHDLEASVAFVLSRPGPARVTADDRHWAQALRALPGGRRWPVHLATADRIQVFAPDDLISAGAA